MIDIEKMVNQQNLKSSLDRFIGTAKVQQLSSLPNLKSSLDRFIDLLIVFNYCTSDDLKSSLDRFIVNTCIRLGANVTFKIQFG